MSAEYEEEIIIRKTKVINVLRKSFNKTFTITFGDQGENHAGMQKIGELVDDGFTLDEILDIKKSLIIEDIRQSITD